MLKVAVSIVLLALAGGSYALSSYVVGSSGGSRQARVDPQFNARVARPAYISRRPRVLFDEAHNNADTAGGRYKPFVDLITSDGYRVTPNTRGFSPSGLAGYEVLVIVNPSGPQG